MNGKNYEVPHFGAFSTPHSHPSWAQIFASGTNNNNNNNNNNNIGNNNPANDFYQCFLNFLHKAPCSSFWNFPFEINVSKAVLFCFDYLSKLDRVQVLLHTRQCFACIPESNSRAYLRNLRQCYRLLAAFNRSGVTEL